MRKVQLSFAAMLALAGILLAVLALHVVPRTEYESRKNPAVQPRNVASTTGVTGDRHVYRNSVVPRGIYSEAEAQAAAQRDEVVRAHYRPVNLHRLRPVVLDQPVDRYVSFRKNGKVYWTSRRMRIPAGELLLADSDSLIRARCGNRLADTPQNPRVPAGVDEPADSELSSIEENATPEYIASPQSELPSVRTAQTSRAGMPQVLAPLAGPGGTVAAAATMNPDQMIYGGSDVVGGGMPVPGQAPQSATAASILTPPQVPAEVPRFESPDAVTVDPTEVVGSGFPPYIPAGAAVTAPINSPASNSGTGGSGSLAGGLNGGIDRSTSVVPPTVPPLEPSSVYVVLDDPALPSLPNPVSTTAFGSEGSASPTGFRDEVPEPSTLGLCLAGLAALVLSRRRRPG